MNHERTKMTLRQLGSGVVSTDGSIAVLDAGMPPFPCVGLVGYSLTA